jgi:predicted RNA-binding protein with PUA-like domain
MPPSEMRNRRLGRRGHIAAARIRRYPWPPPAPSANGAIMAYWLLKTEPGSWSWDDQVRAGASGTFWSGVRNHLAKKHLQAMCRGEQAFFYHSVDEKRIVGIVEVIKEYYPDHTDKTGTFGMVDVKAVARLSHPVTLAEVKADPALAEMVLANNSRLSVQPVTDSEWRHICRRGGVEPL